MAEFEASAAVILKLEGGYVNDPDDPGGETKFGISKRSYPNLDIKNLTWPQAKAIYLRDFWNPLYTQLPQPIADKMMSLSVNDGERTEVRLLQAAVGAPQDGIFGPATLREALRMAPDALLQEIRALAAEHYALVVLHDPREEKELHGWMRRAVA